MPINLQSSYSASRTLTVASPDPWVFPMTVAAGSGKVLLVSMAGAIAFGRVWPYASATDGTGYTGTVTFNGVAMTPVRRTGAGGGSGTSSCGIWMMINPPVGTFNVSLPYVAGSGNENRAAYFAAVFDNVDTAVAITSNQSQAAAALFASPAVTVGASDVAVLVSDVYNPGTVSVPAGTTAMALAVDQGGPAGGKGTWAYSVGAAPRVNYTVSDQFGAVTVVLPGIVAGDVTPPTLTGTITTSAITATTYTLAWPAGADNVAVTGYDYSLDGGTTYTTLGNVLTVNITGRTAGTTDQVRVRARDAAGNLSTPVLSTSVTLAAAGDVTLPTLTGALTPSATTTTTYTLAWPAGADNVAVTGYEVSLDAGSTYTAVGNVLTTNITGRTAGTTDQARVRAFDAAGNRSIPALSAAVTLSAGAGAATITSQPFKNASGTLLASTVIAKVGFVRVSDFVLVLALTNQTTSAAGVLTVSNAALVAGVKYLMITSDATAAAWGSEPYTAA